MIDRLSKRILQAQGARASKQEDLLRLDKQINRVTREGWHIAEARDIIHGLALKTQEEVRSCLETAVSHSLRSVFDEPYNFHVDFEIKRQRTEAALMISLYGDKVHPKDSNGGGLMDLISFTLKVLLWNLASSRPSPVLILDEPFRNLSTDLQPKAGEFLREVQEQMGLQFIIVTHEEELMACADQIYKVSRRRKVSKVEEL